MTICKLCGGDAGRLNEAGEHNLCAALRRLGLPTPSLGTRCTACGGHGRIPKGRVGPILGGASPAADARALDRWAPICRCCLGSGIRPGSRDKPRDDQDPPAGWGRP